MVNEIPGMTVSAHSAEARYRADFEEEGFNFKPWNSSEGYPTSSMPALQATKCAQLQGGEAFERFHIALFKAFFEESRNIGDREVLSSLANEAGLDVEKFSSDLDRGSQEKEVLVEYEEARIKYAGRGIPLAIIGDRYPVMGAAPIAMYRRAIDLCLTNLTRHQT